MVNKTEQSNQGLIVLNAEGDWLHDGVRFSNPKLIALFSRSIRRKTGGDNFELRVGPYIGDVTVEDTAWFITSVDTDQIPWQLTISDGSRRPLDPTSLIFGAANQLYCSIQVEESTAERARFNRSAFQCIFPFFNQNGELEIGGCSIMIPTSSARSS